MVAPNSAPAASGATTETVTLGGGCFWCLEAVFSELKGVQGILPGYAGGTTVDPSYENVCDGNTGHAEVVQVEFDPRVLSLEDLLRIFFATHDPTTPNRQGADVGTQYRSIVFYRDEPQRRTLAGAVREAGELWQRPIVTEQVPFQVFYPAEEYHQRYFERNPGQGYCRMVIAPKVAKVRSTYRERLRSRT